MVAATMLLVQLVRHPTRPGCLWLQMFTFERAAQQLLWQRRSRRQRKIAARKAVGIGGSLESTDDGSTDSTVLLESRSNVDDRTESTDDVRMDAADGADSVVGRMQAVEEVLDEVDRQGSADAGVLPPDGGVQQRLERELESARLEYARQMLWEEEYSSEGAGSDGYKGCVEQSFSARAGGGFDRIAASAEFGGDVWCRAAITEVAPVGEAGARRDPEGVDDVGASRRGPTKTAARLQWHSQRSSGPMFYRSDLYCRW